MVKTFKDLFEERIEKQVIEKYNHNHDTLGRFTFSNGGYSSGGSSGGKQKVQFVNSGGSKGGSRADDNAPPEPSDGGTKETVQFISRGGVKTLDAKDFNERSEQKIAEIKALKKYDDMGGLGTQIDKKKAEVEKATEIVEKYKESGYPPPVKKKPFSFEDCQKESGGTDDQVKEAQGYAEEIEKHWSEKDKDGKTREERVTEAVVKATVESGGSMWGLEAREKTTTSLARKIVKDHLDSVEAHEKDPTKKEITPKEAANDIKDAVRFTAVLDENGFQKGYDSIKKKLKAAGYEEFRCKNFFDDYDKIDNKSHKWASDIKSVQCVYGKRDPKTGEWSDLFELQFHTANSQGAKELSHPMYDESRAKGTDPRRSASLNRKTREIFNDNFVTTPQTSKKIKAHKPSEPKVKKMIE